MPVYREEPRTQFPVIEAYTMLNLKVANISEEESRYTDDAGNKKKQVVFQFDVVDGTYAGRKLWGRCPATWYANSKLHTWAERILAKQFAPGEPLNTDDLMDKTCRGVVQVSNRADGTQGNYVEDVLTAKELSPVEQTTF